MMAVNTLHLVSDVLWRGVGTTILLPRCVGWYLMVGGCVQLAFEFEG